MDSTVLQLALKIMFSTTSSTIKYRPEIDGLRALAVLMVLVVHYFPTKMRGGFIGVDVFFVISGFLITGILHAELSAGKLNIVDFYARRAVRIFPALILVLLSCLSFGWFALFADEYQSLGRSVAAGAAFIANINLYNEVGYWDVSSKLKPLLHLWSLGVEEQFYLLFPCVLWGVWKSKLKPVAVLALCAMASALWCFLSMRTDPAAAFYLPMQRAWELIAGAMLALYMQVPLGQEGSNTANQRTTLSHRMFANVGAVLGVCMILFAAFGLDETIPFPGKWSLLPVGGAMLLLLAGASAAINRILFSNRLAVYVGKISFPLYLWHWPLLSFAQIIDSGSPSSRTRNIALLLSFVLAVLTYHFVEKPLRFGSQARGVKALCLSVLLAILGATSFAIYWNGGMRDRAIEQNKAIDPFTILRPPMAQDDTNGCFRGLPELFKSNLQQGRIAGTMVHCQARGIEDVTIVMIGDSNAGQYAKSLHEHFGKSILTIHSSGRPYVRDFFDDETSQVLIDFVLRQPQIKTVILSHLGVEMTQGDAPSLAKAQRLLHPSYEPGLKKTVEAFQAAGKRVILMGSIPVLDFNPKRCQARPFANHTLPERCVIPRTEIAITHRPYLEMMSHFRSEFPKLEIVDAMDSLCDERVCYAKKDGLVLYADKKHVNFFGSTLVAKPLIALIESGVVQ